MVNPEPRRVATARLKVLFFAEGATLAHVTRPLVLARTLDPNRFDVTFARPLALKWLTSDAAFHVTDLPCQHASVFARRLEYGLPLYDYTTLRRYVKDDLALIDSEKPDVIVGDFRLSLSVSARLRSIPYVTICDAYWSPERPLRAPLPVLSFTRLTPIPVAEFLFRCVSGLALRLHAAPLERLRAKYGLPSLGFDIRRCYTDADLRLFANIPALFPDVRPTSEAAFIGPINWSPDYTGRLDFLDSIEPLIYVSMGSSGDPRILKTLIPILEQTNNQVVVTTAGKRLPFSLNSNRTKVFDYLPGDTVCRHATLVVCNGGSPTTNQALVNGVPVLGVTQNMDQFLNMQAIAKFGAGIQIRADRVDKTTLMKALKGLIGETHFRSCARALAASAKTGSLEASLAAHIAALYLNREAASAKEL